MTIYRLFNEMHASDYDSLQEAKDHASFYTDQIDWRTDIVGPHGPYMHHFGDNHKTTPYIHKLFEIVELPEDHDLCRTCRGVGYILHFYERSGPAPGNMFMGCDDCQEGRDHSYADLVSLYGRYGSETVERIWAEYSKRFKWTFQQWLDWYWEQPENAREREDVFERGRKMSTSLWAKYDYYLKEAP